MPGTTFLHIEESIARCRVILSLSALAAVFIDPTQPVLTRWIPLTGGSFTINPYAFFTMSAHLCYSVAILFLRRSRRTSGSGSSTITTWLDVLFGTAIAVFTEGTNSPFYAFFAFAVVETGLRTGFRQTMAVTAVSVGIYLSLIAISASGNRNVYIMRPVYLALTGYLIGYLGQQRLNLEAGIRELAAASQRQQIARDLHDGRAQALAGITLKLQSCQELLHRGRSNEALLDLSELENSVNREYDELRGYLRSLVGAVAPPRWRRSAQQTRFTINAQFDGSADLVEQVLQILREAVSNVVHHAQARDATMSVRVSREEFLITIDDNGLGFQEPAQLPWSIASRVTELGGDMQLISTKGPGAHLAITFPRS